MTCRSRASLPMLLVLLALAGGCDGGGGGSASTAPAVDRSTPKTVSKALFQATYDNDRATAIQCVTPEPHQAEAVEAMTVVSTGMRKATDAMMKRWGQDIEKNFGNVDATRINPQQIDQGAERITGDTATIATKQQTIYLVRGNDGWRVDLARTFKLDPKMMAMAKPMFTAMGQAGEEVARDVEAGKYTNLQEGVKALQARIKQAIDRETKRMLDNPPKNLQ